MHLNILCVHRNIQDLFQRIVDDQRFPSCCLYHWRRRIDFYLTHLSQLKLQLRPNNVIATEYVTQVFREMPFCLLGDAGQNGIQRHSESTLVQKSPDNYSTFNISSALSSWETDHLDFFPLSHCIGLLESHTCQLQHEHAVCHPCRSRLRPLNYPSSNYSLWIIAKWSWNANIYFPLCSYLWKWWIFRSFWF